MPTANHNKNVARKIPAGGCEVCASVIGQGEGYYLLTMTTKGGRRVKWKIDSMKCLGEFAGKYAHLDTALKLGRDVKRPRRAGDTEGETEAE